MKGQVLAIGKEGDRLSLPVLIVVIVQSSITLNTLLAFYTLFMLGSIRKVGNKINDQKEKPFWFPTFQPFPRCCRLRMATALVSGLLS